MSGTRMSAAAYEKAAQPLPRLRRLVGHARAPAAPERREAQSPVLMTMSVMGPRERSPLSTMWP